MRRSILVLVLVIMAGSPTVANAQLFDNGDGTITEVRGDGSQLMWLKDGYLLLTGECELVWTGGSMPWTEAEKWIDCLNQIEYAGYNDWRFPKVVPIDPNDYTLAKSCDGSTDYGYNIKDLRSELGHLYFVSLNNKGPYQSVPDPPKEYPDPPPPCPEYEEVEPLKSVNTSIPI